MYLLTILYSICIILMLITSVIVLKNAPYEKRNQAFFFLGVSAIAWIVTGYLGYFFIPSDVKLSLQFFRLEYGASIYLLLCLIAFFYYFPRKTFEVPQSIVYGFHIMSFFFFILCSFTSYIYADLSLKDDLLIDSLGPFYLGYVVYCIAQFSFAALLAIKKLLKNKGIEREKILYISIGFFITFLIGTLINVILPIFGIVIFQRESIALLGVFFVTIFYSFYKQRFFHLSYISLNLLRNLILWASFIALTIFIYIFIDRTFLPAGTMTGIISATLGFLGYLALNKVFPKLQHQSFRFFKKVIHEFDAKLSSCKTYQQLIQLFKKTFIEHLCISDINILMVEKDKGNNAISVYPQNSFTKQLSGINDILLFDEIASKQIKTNQDKVYLETLKEFNATLCCPLFAEDHLIGFFTLGQKAGNAPFNQEEIEELLKIKHHVEIVFTNIYITHTLSEENDILKKIVDEKTKHLKVTNQELQKRYEIEKETTTILSHEIKTPIAVAMNTLQLCNMTFEMDREKIAPETLEELRKKAELIKQSLKRVIDICSTIFTFREVETQDMSQILALNLELSMLPVLENFERQALEKGLQFTYSFKISEGEFYGGGIQFEQVAIILIDNALKYTEKGYVDVKIEQNKKVLRCKVTDTGYGIPKNKRKAVFERFYRHRTEENRTLQHVKGLGLGLYIAKRIVENLEGSIKIENNSQEKGSQFIVEIPVYSSKEKQKAR